MAGAASEDNPVDINVVPLIDVIFCICIFFFCSFHFKQLEGKIESWMPKDKGIFAGQVTNPVLDEVRVLMEWREEEKRTIRKVGAKVCDTDQEIYDNVVAGHEDLKRAGKSDAPVIIDAGTEKGRMVPWADVVTVMDICKKAGIPKIEFAAPVGYKMPETIKQ